MTNLQEKSTRLLTCAYILSLSVLIVTIKLSGLALGAMAVLGICILFLKRNPVQCRFFWVVLLLPVVLGAGHLVRGIYLSGWLLYPIPWGDFGLPWSIPKDAVLSQVKWIESWAKLPGRHYNEVLGLGFAHWFIPWVQSQRGSLEFYYALFAPMATLTWIVVVLKNRRQTTNLLGKASLLLCGYVALGYWFLTAPGLRFGSFLIYILFGLSSAILFSETSVSKLLTPNLFKIIVACWLFFIFAPSAYLPTTSTVLDRPQAPPVSKYKHVEMIDAQGQSGTIITPESGDQCWNSPLPCTPYPHDFQPVDFYNLKKGFNPVGSNPDVPR